MTITKELPLEQIRALGLHQGDMLRVESERNGVAVVQIRQYPAELSSDKLGLVTEWLKKYAGSVELAPGETFESLKEAHHRDKYGM